jgi:hypothetical protein
MGRTSGKRRCRDGGAREKALQMRSMSIQVTAPPASRYT